MADFSSVTFSSVTWLYTANLKGDLHLLPRLFTLIQQERRSAHEANSLALLLDLGDTCALDSWVCPATQGRAPFLVLDAMGYDMALIGAGEQVSIPPDSLRRLLDTIMMRVALWNRPGHFTKRGITFHLASGTADFPAAEPGIRIDRTTTALPGANATPPVLGDVARGHLARVTMAWPDWTVQDARLLPLPETTSPDPTIAAVVELVENEARHYAQQEGGVT
ncbi:MAG: hypothetical protein JXQ72_07845 [Anaerolineae bacterium]|nr:hypothetical protein [Anaerolineae bacterium]